MKAHSRIGETKLMNCGMSCSIIEYKNTKKNKSKIC